MVSRVLLALSLALLKAIAGDHDENNSIELKKCCGEYEMLSSDGRSCVQAPWPRNVSFQRDKFGFIIHPQNDPSSGEWVQHWLPPGLPPENVARVSLHYNNYSYYYKDCVSSVNASSLWNSSSIENESPSRNTITFPAYDLIARPKPGGGFRWADYCVDAALPPLGPFAMRFATFCSKDECAIKCCSEGQLMMKKNDGLWNCTRDAESYWEPNKSSLALDPEFPTRTFTPWEGIQTQRLRLSPWDVRNALQALRDEGIIQFHFSTWRTCFDFYRSSDGSLHEGLFYQEYPYVTRGIYWLLRPLCILSALLLLASLISIACNKIMRRNIHGWCLASHTACLLAFNIGHIWYYLTISDLVNNLFPVYISRNHPNVCKYVALSMYFLQTTAWFWLTALCVNMAMGFSIQVARPKRKSGKRFAALSAVAWGLPALMTTCSSLFIQDFGKPEAKWYTPSLAESRVCYNEIFEFLNYRNGKGNGTHKSFVRGLSKSGTALHFYGPVCCLVMCNVICLALAMRKVQYLKRGNSVLRREEDQILLGQSQQGSQPPSTSEHSSKGNRTRSRSGSTVNSKTIKMYIKMILMTGATELLTEVIVWSTTVYDPYKFFVYDISLEYRTVGYVTDFFRAAVVSWLAAPEGGYLCLVRRLRRCKGEKKKNVA